MNKRFIIICVSCLCLVFVQFGQAWAAETSSDNLTYETTFTNTDIGLSGVRASKQVHFQTEDYWKVSDVSIYLDYKSSPLTRTERSSITLTMNGTKFHSFRPVVGEDLKQQATVKVPKELILKGKNTLTIEGYIQTVSEYQVCVPPEARDNWFQIYSTSGVAVHYTNEAPNGSINDFNRRFIGLDTVSTGQNAISVPKQGNPAELEAAVYALSGFAKTNSLKDKTIPIIAYGNENLNDKKAIVAVALYDQLPANIKGMLESQDLNDKALIQMMNKDKQPTLVLTSQNPDLLVKAGRLVANQELMRQLDSSTKVVDNQTDVTTAEVSINKNVKLTDTGDELKGWMHQEKTYFVSLPANRSLADASKVSLDFRYAKNLDFDRSLVTVLVNNTPIGSKKLTSELADGDAVTLPIPKNLNITGNFAVTVAFDLELKDAGCIQLQDETPWAFITKDTMLQLHTKDKTDLLFDNYPYPFLHDGSFNQVGVILPEEHDAYTYLTLSNVFNLLGQYAEGNTGNVRFYGDSTSSSDLQERNIIAIGTYQNNKIVRENNSHLYFQYDQARSSFQSNEKMSIDTDYGKRIGTLQLIRSPYESGHGLLAITGAGSEYYYLASKLITSESTKWKVFGDGVAVDKDGNINPYRFKKEAEQEPSSIMDKVMQRGDVFGFIAAAVLVMVLVLVSLILMIRKYRRNREGER